MILISQFNNIHTLTKVNVDFAALILIGIGILLLIYIFVILKIINFIRQQKELNMRYLIKLEEQSVAHDHEVNDSKT